VFVQVKLFRMDFRFHPCFLSQEESGNCAEVSFNLNYVAGRIELNFADLAALILAAHLVIAVR
jgi:hypothetical protein